MTGKKSKAAAEPSPLAGAVCFEEGDFHSLSPSLARDTEGNARRLVARRKLLTLGKETVKRAAALEVGARKLECRTSLHHPHAFNGMRVQRLWAYLVRSKADKRKLKSVLGSDLGKDLDAAYKNVYLSIALESEALEVGLRIHSDAWYDGQNLKRKVEREGLAPWLSELQELRGFFLRIDDWRGEWRCGELTPERLEEFLSYYTPGEHRLTVERRWPAPAGARSAALEPEAAEELMRECLRLVPLFNFVGWSPENDFLFG